jgi:hypothetical protein
MSATHKWALELIDTDPIHMFTVYSSNHHTCLHIRSSHLIGRHELQTPLDGLHEVAVPEEERRRGEEEEIQVRTFANLENRLILEYLINFRH